MERPSFHKDARSSKSYDDLENHYDSFNIHTSNGYAKIGPRNRQIYLPDAENGKSQDMLAYKPSDSIVSPQFLFDHPVYASHSQFDSNPYLSHYQATRIKNTNMRKKVKYQKIVPKTSTMRLVDPYSKVPIKFRDNHNEHEPENSENCVPASYQSNVMLMSEQVAKPASHNYAKVDKTSSHKQKSFNRSSSESRHIYVESQHNSSNISDIKINDDTNSTNDYADISSDSDEIMEEY